MALQTRQPKNARLLYRETSHPEDQVPFHVSGLRTFNNSGGEAPEEEVSAFEGVASETGELRIGQIDCEGFLNPSAPETVDLHRLAEEQALVQFWFVVPEELIFTGQQQTAERALLTALAANEGAAVTPLDFSAVTNAPDFRDNRFGVGNVLKVDNQYVASLAEVSHGGTGTARVRRQGHGTGLMWDDMVAPYLVGAGKLAIPATTAWSIVKPRVQRKFLATIKVTGQDQNEAERAMQGPLALKPLNRLPRYMATIQPANWPV